MEIKLTQTQSLAVTARGKNILISAGAGTGKTRVLVERFLNYVQQGDALVTEILALTFTEKAANEMKSRILERFEKLGMQTARRDLEVAYISTIHAFAARVLREHPIEAGVDPSLELWKAMNLFLCVNKFLTNSLKNCVNLSL
jgi:ATP-dependent helicase/nuclease subunit A